MFCTYIPFVPATACLSSSGFFYPQSFKFRLSEERFPTLKVLRETEQELQMNISREIDIVLRKIKGSPEVTNYEGRCVADKHLGDFCCGD